MAFVSFTHFPYPGGGGALIFTKGPFSRPSEVVTDIKRESVLFDAPWLDPPRKPLPKDNDDIEPIRTKIQALSTAIQKVGAAMYEQGTPAQPGDVGTVDPNEKEIPSEDKPVDAEFTEVSKDEEGK